MSNVTKLILRQEKVSTMKKKKNTAYKSERRKEFIIGIVYLLLAMFIIHKKGKNDSIQFQMHHAIFIDFLSYAKPWNFREAKLSLNPSMSTM